MKPKWKNWYRFILWMICYPGAIVSVATIAAWYLSLESLYRIVGGITMIFEDLYHRFCE